MTVAPILFGLFPAEAQQLLPAFGKMLFGEMVAKGRPEYQGVPIAVKCWARLDSTIQYILGCK